MDLTPDVYCRQLEDYLCRKNDGHLVRIVGPAFEQVCGWAERGVPLRIAQRGIDRYFERYYAKGPRRRPVRIEFCEADVLDVFDEWRRAVGVPADPAPQAIVGVTRASAPPAVVEADLQVGQPSGVNGDSRADPTEEPDAHSRRHGSLPAHVDRVIARLTTLRAGADRSLDPVLDAIVRELDAARATVKGLRGSARETFLERLTALDRMLIESARAHCDPALLERLAADAAADLAPFRDRLSPEAFQRAQAASLDRAIRERLRLPTLGFE